jgi:putative toxin-antitoxin system antitoxin component (TIGR02293 family)
VVGEATEAAGIELASEWRNLLESHNFSEKSSLLQQPHQDPGRIDDIAIWRDNHARGRGWSRRVRVDNPREVEGVVSVLGGAAVVGRNVRSPADLAERVRKGLPFAALSAVMERYGISRDVICTILHLSARNFLRRREQKRLSPDESDRLYRLARVIAHANRVFEDPEQSADWIQSPNVALGKQQPLTLLDTDIGVQQVDQVLGRIEHGIVG